MKSFVFAVATCLGLVVPMGLVALTAGDARAARALVYDVKFNDSAVQLTADHLSPGDRIVLSDSLWREGKSSGRIEGICTVTSGDGTAICNANLMLADGTIAIQFVDAPPRSKDFAVVGGTGAYAGLLGSGTVVEHENQTGTLTLTLG
jgi:hypothetical protein